MTRHRIEQIMFGLGAVALLLFSVMSFTVRLWVYGGVMVVASTLLIAWHVIPWVRRRGWRRQSPWPWTMPEREHDDSHAFWGY